MEVLRRNTYLSSLREQIEPLIDGTRLHITHTDPAFLHYDPRYSVAWLTDVGQFEWLLTNHDHLLNDGVRVSRIMVLPAAPALVKKDVFGYYAAVKAVMHLQMFEGVEIGAWFANTDRARRLNFSLAKAGRHLFGWPSPDYYGNLRSAEARQANSTQVCRLDVEVSTLRDEVFWLGPYRDEHFSSERVSLPKRWRQFLVRLQGGVCLDCDARLELGSHIDHERPLAPEESPFHTAASGNSNMFNLGALCPNCNLRKGRKMQEAPEQRLRTLVWDLKLKSYLRASLAQPPSQMPHRLPLPEEIPPDLL